MNSVNKKLVTKRKIILRKGKKLVMKRKRIVMQETTEKNVTATSASIVFDIDLDTPPHQLALGNSKEVCDPLVETLNEKQIDRKDPESPEKGICVDGAGRKDRNRKFTEESEYSLLSNVQQPATADGEIQWDERESNQFSQDLENYGEDENDVLELNHSRLDETLDDSDTTQPENHCQEENIHMSSMHIENAQINLKELMGGDNPVWEEILTRYEENGSMTKKNRKALNAAIVQYARVKKIYLDLDLMENISFQIRTIFPTERMSSYFMKNGKRISGSLYNLYHRDRSDNNKEKKERIRFETLVDETDLPEPTESIAILQSDGQANNVYIEHWEKTLEYRQKKMPLYDTFDDFINEWPIVAKEVGLFLISLDFKEIYGKRSLTSSSNWNFFFQKNWNYMMKNINEKGKSFAMKVAKLEESPAKDAAMSFILHYLLPPAYRALHWKPTCNDSQDTFLKFVKNECIDQVIANRNKSCDERGIKWHPYIIGQGRSKRKIHNFSVVIHNTKIECKDFLTALELCFKIYILLDIPYPPESKAVWVLLNRLFINIKIDTLMTSRISTLVNDLM